jgi:hypothetical protein
MKFSLIIKFFAALIVIGIAFFTYLLVSHVRGNSLGGVFSQIVPKEQEVKPMAQLPTSNSDLPEIDPGSQVFDKAVESLAMGEVAEAKEKLNNVVTTYPRSKSAPEARRILGEMNLDEILSPANMTGKSVHVVRSGEAFLGIATSNKTSLDLMIFLNNLLDLKGLKPGEELIVMPQNFRMMIEPTKKVLTVWDGDRFVKEYPILHVDKAALKLAQKTKISGKSGTVGDKRTMAGSKDYIAASKLIHLEKCPFSIRALPQDLDPKQEAVSSLGKSFFVSKTDMEELTLLFRVGNEVEIRAGTP